MLILMGKKEKINLFLNNENKSISILPKKKKNGRKSFGQEVKQKKSTRIK